MKFSVPEYTDFFVILLTAPPGFLVTFFKRGMQSVHNYEHNNRYSNPSNNHPQNLDTQKKREECP